MSPPSLPSGVFSGRRTQRRFRASRPPPYARASSEKQRGSHPMVFGALNPRNRSLPRGTVLVLGSLVLAFSLAGFPDDRPSLKLMIPTFLAALGTGDTIRCLQHR